MIGKDGKDYKITPKQFAFIHRYIECGDASEAYRHAYNTEKMADSTINRSAKELIDNRKITTEIEAIQRENRERLKVSVDSLTKELDENRALALKEKQSGAATQATKAKAQLHGLLIDKQQVTHTEGAKWAESYYKDWERRQKESGYIEH